MAEQDNSEDVDVYISPRRFMGCTPGPKASRQKVFQENEEERAQEEKKKKSENVTLGIEEELDSPYDPKREGKLNTLNHLICNNITNSV